MWKRDLSKLKAADRAEWHRQVKIARRTRWRARWAWWVAFWKKRAGELKIAASVIGIVTGIWQSPLIVRAARQVKRFGIWAKAIYQDRDLAEPDLPPGNGVPSTFVDRRDPPKTSK